MNDTLIFLVLAGLAFVFKFLTKAAAGGTEGKSKPSPPNEQSLPSSPPNEEERVRRFLEALGAPPGTQPPPPIRPRSPVAPRPVTAPPARAPRHVRQRKWEQPLPPFTTSPLPPPVVTEIPASAPPEMKAAPPPPPLVAPVALPPPLGRSPWATPSRLPPVLPLLGQMLRTRGAVRQAIILREVLGPPRGLQDLVDARD